MYGLQQRIGTFSPVILRPAWVNSVSQLEALFGQLNYQWPPQYSVPAISVRTLPPDFHTLSAEKKKSLFFRSLLPLVMAENTLLRQERVWLQLVQKGRIKADQKRLNELASVFRVREELPRDELVTQLLLRVDEVPAGLVLAQAANESGWGTSRFSREVNNLFGEWTWDADNGVMPHRRPQSASHYVRRFDSLRASVRSYLHNINTGHAYEEFRELRAAMRSEGARLDPLRLASALEKYSARGREYVHEIQVMIRSNGLNKLGQIDLLH